MYTSRPDIQAIEYYLYLNTVLRDEFIDAIQRFRLALELRSPGNISEVVLNFELPPNSPPDLDSDLEELRKAVGLELRKTALLLTGSIAEALLLERHPDNTDRGPGLRKLVKEE